MPVCIVRVGGYRVNDLRSLEKLDQFLSKHNSLKMVIVSALPEIYQTIEARIGQVFHPEAGTDDVAAGLYDQYRSVLGEEPGELFVNATESLSQLLKGIFLTGDYSPALKDTVLSFSEQLTALLLIRRLELIGRSAALLLPAELDLKASPDFGNATFLSFQPEKAETLSAETTWVIPGSWGTAENGRVARAGRSAADYTAAFLAAGLSAEKLVLWGAEKEFYAADRAIVPQAALIGRLTYAEASELAYFDHYSFHPRAVEPLVSKHIPIHLVSGETSGFTPDTIINSEDFIAPQVVKSVACTDDVSILRLNGPGVGLKPGILARITGKLSEAAINIKSVITSQVSINILIDRKSGAGAVKAARELGFTAVNEISLLEKVSLIAIVGHGMQQNYGISATLFNAVARNRINVILSGSGASDLVSYLVVEAPDREKSVKAIYQAFLEPDQK